MRAFDTFVTITLFVLLVAAVLFSVYLGGMSTMLSDSGAPGIAAAGVFLAMFGIPISAVIIYVVAVLSAWQSDGPTFYYPVVALGVMVVAAALVVGLSLAIIALGQRIHVSESPLSLPAGALPVTPAVSACRGMTYDKTHFFRQGHRDAELGVERSTGRRYLAVTLPQRDQQYREYFGLDRQTYDAFVAEPEDAIFFADKCRSGTYVTDRMPSAGSPVPEPIRAGQRGLTRKRAILFTDVPTTAMGVPVDLPPGTPFVSIFDDAVNSAGNVVAHARGNATRLEIAADQLGIV